MIALKSRPERGSENKATCRGSPTPPSYRALGAKSPVCETHRKAEQEYSAVKAVVKAESQRKLDLALKKVQSTRTTRSACLTNMFVRPKSAVAGLSQVWEEMTHSDPNSSISVEFYGPNSEGERQYDFASENGKGNPHRNGQPISANNIMLGKNRLVFMPKYQAPSENSEDVDLLQQNYRDFFYFRDNMKEAATPSDIKACTGSKSSNWTSYEPSRRQKLIFSYLRREMRREKSIVVPLGSIPATLQVKGHNSGFYSYPRLFQSKKSTTQDHKSEAPSRSVQQINRASKPFSTPLPRSPSPVKTPVQNITPRSKPTKTVYRDLGVVTEYKLKMASLMTQPDQMVTLSHRPATAGPLNYSRDHVTETQTSNSNVIALKIAQDTRQDIIHQMRPKSARGNDGTMAMTIPTQENQQGARLESRAHNRPEKSSNNSSFSKSSYDARKIRSLTTVPTGKNLSFVKGVKYGETVERKQIKESKEVPLVTSRGVEGKTELSSKSPRSLSLSVFLPRETNEEPLCHRADTFSRKTNNAATGFTPNHDQTNKCIQRQSNSPNRSSSLHYSHVGSTLTAPEQKETSPCDSNNTCGLNQSVAPPTLTPVNCQKGHLRVLHCELFGPELCQDCQVHMDRADVYTWQQAVHPDVGTGRVALWDVKILCLAPAIDDSIISINDWLYLHSLFITM